MPQPVPDRARRRRRARRRALAMVRLTAIRARLGALRLVRPAAADELALRIWATPPRPPAPVADGGPGPGEVVRLPLARGGDAVAESWGEGPNVYLVHGWGGRRRQMDAFVAPLVATGHRVVAVDAPGHGDAGPSFLGAGLSTIVEFFDALDAAVAHFGPPEAVVGHSMGTTVAAHAVVHRGLRPARLVLVAPAPPFTATLDRLADVLHLPARTLAHVQARIDEVLGLPMSTLDLVRLGADGGSGAGRQGALPPTLVVHDRGDREAPFTTAEHIVATWPDARLVPTDGLGHNRILRAPATVRAAVGHITDRVAVG